MPTPLKTYRTKNIVISLPKPNTYPWIEFSMQELYIDPVSGETLQLVDDAIRQNRRFDTVATDMVQYTDPITGETREISVAGIASAVKSAIIKWVTDDGSKIYIADRDMIVDKPRS